LLSLHSQTSQENHQTDFLLLTLSVLLHYLYFLEMIPQTIITPIPSKIPFPPMFAIPDITTTLAFFMALMV